MKNLIIYLFFILMPAGVPAQYNLTANEPAGFSSVDNAASVAKQIVKASGIVANFAIAEGNVPNAAAVMIQEKRFVLYNPRFMNALTHITGTKWAAVSVLAHEIGHHLYGGSGTKMASELEADEFSGYVLKKMGATLAEAEAAMSLLSKTAASPTHPAGADRIYSIAKGWKNAGGTDPVLANKQPKVLASSSEGPIMTGIEIEATIYFSANPQAKFYVTKQMQVVIPGNSGVKAIGRLRRSIIIDYPYILFDDTGYCFFIHSSGAIVNGNGKIVGHLEAGSQSG